MSLLLDAATGDGTARERVLFGASIPAGTRLGDFEAFAAQIAPRRIDLPMFFQAWGKDPLWFSAYPGYVTGLGADAMYVTTSPAGPLSSCLDGRYDAYIAAEAKRAAAYGRPVLLRLAHEFNGGPWNPYGAGQEAGPEFAAAWRYIVDRFRRGGASNLLWLWCPNIWTGAGDANTADPTPFYPGDEYVDFIGLDGYMMKTSPALAYPADLFAANYQAATKLSPRPFMIGEVGCSDDPRLLAAPGGKAEWYRRLFAMVRDDMPRCVAISQWQRGPHAGDVNDYTIDSSGAAQQATATFKVGLLAPPLSPLSGRAKPPGRRRSRRTTSRPGRSPTSLGTDWGSARRVPSPAGSPPSTR